MTAAPVLVEASLPQACEVCEGSQAVEIAILAWSALRWWSPCLHCVLGLPIRYYPREAR